MIDEGVIGQEESNSKNETNEKQIEYRKSKFQTMIARIEEIEIRLRIQEVASRPPLNLEQMVLKPEEESEATMNTRKRSDSPHSSPRSYKSIRVELSEKSSKRE